MSFDRFPGAASKSYSSPKQHHVVRGERLLTTGSEKAPTDRRVDFAEKFRFLEDGTVVWQRIDDEGGRNETVTDGDGTWSFVEQQTKVQIRIVDRKMRKVLVYSQTVSFDGKTGVCALAEMVDGENLDVDAIEPCRK